MKVCGEEILLRAHVEEIQGYSAHAGRSEMCKTCFPPCSGAQGVAWIVRHRQRALTSDGGAHFRGGAPVR